MCFESVSKPQDAPRVAAATASKLSSDEANRSRAGVRLLRWTIEYQLRQRQTRRKAATQSYGPTSHGDTAAEPPKAKYRSESAALIRCGCRAFSCPRPVPKGSRVMVRLFSLRGPREWAGATNRTERAPHANANRSLNERAHPDAAGRGHTPPTPDPDPRDPGARNACSLRLSELVSNIRLGRTLSPDRPAPPGRA